MNLFIGERGRGLLIWMDKIATVYTPNSNSGRGQIDVKKEEIKMAFEEMRRELRLLKESMEVQHMQK